jgi:hypothetical protein
MKKKHRLCVRLFLLFLVSGHISLGQGPDTLKRYIKVSVGPEYRSSSFHQWLWGRNYRKEWTTPVQFPVLFLDTLKGGLIPYKEGGGHQSKSLHLKTKAGKEYALRSVDKALSGLVPDVFHHTFLEHLANEISMSHPYGALGLSLMEQAAHIYHSNPEYFYLPEQPALDTFNKKYGNHVYLFEQRPAGDWSDADNLGNFKDMISSEEMLDNIYGDNDRQVDQLAFAKARLFDIFIADWDRHMDQWKWGVVDKGKKELYEPIPTDRDQAFFKHDGILLNSAIAASNLKFLQSFDYRIHDPKVYSFETRLLDRLLTNQLTLAEWQTIAQEMQQALTDDIIESSIKQMPPEIFAISGTKIIAKLKSRRNHLIEYATAYYRFLAKQVEIVGSKKQEDFEIARLSDDETAVRLYKINKEGKKEDTAFYSRVFRTKETKEIRLYGLAGKDIYRIDGKVNKGINIRIIGGSDSDSMINHSRVSGKNKTHLYDDPDNYFQVGPGARLHLSRDSALHAFDYNAFLPDLKGILSSAGYTNDDHFFIGLRYRLLHHKWRKLPFASKSNFDFRYSITQRAFSLTYDGLFPKAIGKWDFFLKANYDWIRWTNFFGLGNETTLATKEIDYYRMRTRESLVNAGIYRAFGMNSFRFSGFFQSVKIINDPGRFIAKTFEVSNPGIFNVSNYAGLQASWHLLHIKDSVLPERGFTFFADVAHTQNITAGNKSFQKYSGALQIFVPVVPKLSLAIRTGATTITGTPEFYQFPSIGESYNLRGFMRERFYGRTVFYNSNELRFMGPVKSYIFNGKAGILAFLDEGRVWMPLESSDTWHYGYGGGLLIAPFDKITAELTYGISKEGGRVQLRVGKLF